MGYREAAMAIDQQLDIWPDRFSHGGEVRGRLYGMAVVRVLVEAVPTPRTRPALERGVPFIRFFSRHLRRVFGRDAAKVRIDLDPVAELAAQKFDHRQVGYLALDVPQGLVNAAHGTHPHGTRHAPDSAQGGTLIELVPQVLDASRVFAD